MRKILGRGVILVCLVFLLSSLAFAQKEDSNAILNQLNSELEKEAAFMPRDLAAINRPLKNMLDKGATKEDLRRLLKDLSRKEIKGRELKNTVDVMNDLVNSGESPKQAGNVVSRAAHLAQAQGLKGTALAVKVHEAIKDRKAEREKIKEQKKAQKEGPKQSPATGRGHGHSAEGKGKK